MISRGFDNAECEARTKRAQEKLASQEPRWPASYD